MHFSIKLTSKIILQASRQAGRQAGMGEGEVADAVETTRDDVETTRVPVCT